MLRIGSIRVPIRSSGLDWARVPQLAPEWSGLLDLSVSRRHLEFLARKDSLGQDALLLTDGADTTYGRLLGMRYCQLASREMEVVLLTAETRSSDLTQMRAMRGTSAVFEDGPVVKAALAGRILLLDQLQFCEPNVMPLLNSLSEAREMMLDDGRLIISSVRFRQMLARGSSVEALERHGIIECHPDFRVLGLTTVGRGGTPLDPPLRSRLQCRAVANPSLNEVGNWLSRSSFPDSVVRQTVGLMEAHSLQEENIAFPVYAAREFVAGSSEDEILKKFFGTDKSMDEASADDLVGALSRHRFVSLIGEKGSGRRHLAMEAAGRLGVEVTSVQVQETSSLRDILGVRAGGNQHSSWLPSALTRAMRNGEMAIIEGDLSESFQRALSTLLQTQRVELPSGELITSFAPSFCVCIIGEKPFQHSPFPALRIRGLKSEEDFLDALKQHPLLAGDHEKRVGLLEAVALVASKLNAAGIAFTLTNAVNSILLARAIPLDEVIRDCVLFRFLSEEKKVLVDAAIATIHGGVPLVDPSFLQTPHQRRPLEPGHEHLIPHVHASYTSNLGAERTLNKIKAYLKLQLPLLLLGVQGTGKNMMIDVCCQQEKIPRHYLQLHLDSTQESLFSQMTVVDGQICQQESPLLDAIRLGHVCVLDELDKASPSVIGTLRSLIKGSFRMPDGRMIGRDEKTADILIHRDFSLVCLANPGVAPFLGANVREELGSVVNAVVVDPPSRDAMTQILASYNSDPSKNDVVKRLAGAFSELSTIQLDSNYTYGLREAISVVKDIQLNEGSLESSLATVFDYERDSVVRQQLANVFSKHGLSFDVSGDTARLDPGRDVRIAREASGVSAQDPKHGKEPDGNPHVGGNTWAGGTGGSSTAGLGGRHGPYRLDLGHNVHQVPDEAKVWTDPEAERRARSMAAEALKARLEEIRMAPAQYEAYESYRSKIEPAIRSLRTIVANLTPPAKSSKWVRGKSDGILDERRLVEALIGEKNVFKRLTRKDPVHGAGAKGKIWIDLVLDCSASMYRFNGYDHRLTRELECAVLVMEALGEESGGVVQCNLTGHSGEDKRVQLLDQEWTLPRDIKERYNVLERIVAHTQYCWSGDSTFKALQESIRTLEHVGEPEDERHCIMLSDANFERYGLRPYQYAQIASSSEQVVCTSIFIGTLGNEALRLKAALPQKTSYVCQHTAEIVTVLAERLKKTVARNRSL